MSEIFTTRDGRKLAFRRNGSGPPLICHSGGPGFSGRSLGNLGGLSEHFELVVLDPRGTGASDRPADREAYRLEDYVGDLDELREQLGLRRFDLLGHSHGGFVAICYAAAHPRRARRLVLAATATRFAPEYFAAIELFWDESDDPAVAQARASRARRFAEGWDDDRDLAALMAREIPLSFSDPRRAPSFLELVEGERPNGDALRFFNNEIAPQFDLRPQLRHIEAPTLVITGEHDYFGALAAAEIAECVPRAECVVLSRAGHFVWMEAPERFREEVGRFLRA